MNNIIYHITTKAEWAQANETGFYEAPSLAVEGFIHSSDQYQIEGVLARYFVGKGPLVKLTIDTSILRSRFQYDFSPTINEAFPHIYGRLNLDAVIGEEDI